MKNLILLLLMSLSVTAYSQKVNMKEKAEKNHFSAEERATLSSKRIALQLDLSEMQRIEIEKLIAERFKAQKKLVQERNNNTKRNIRKQADRFSKMNSRLDYKLAQQEKIKEILNEEQYEQWKQLAKKPVETRIIMKKRKL